MNDRDQTRLREMLDAALEAKRFIQRKKRSDLENNKMLAFALARAVEIVGEAASQVSQETRDQYPSIPWRAIVGMRHKIVHEYFDIDYDILWDVAANDIPDLVRELQTILTRR